MIKACCLFFLVCFTGICCAQTSNTYYGVVLTRVITEGKEKDTSKLLYCRNIADDRLSVYTVATGVVSEATAYHLTTSKNGLYLYSRPLPGEQVADSLRIDFQDKKNTVLINKTDRYVLFPTYYARFKQEVNEKHSIMTLLNLLVDGLGDYPIANALPLLNYTPQLDKQIKKATVVTQRSQAHMKDTWTCNYYYNKYNKLDSVSVKSMEENRFYKKVHYHVNKAYSISTYLNIEDRQVTDRTISYGPQVRSLVKWQQSYVEMGKNRETTSSVTWKWHDLGMSRNLEPSNAEVLQLLKPKKTNNDFTKKHSD